MIRQMQMVLSSQSGEKAKESKCQSLKQTKSQSSTCNITQLWCCVSKWTFLLNRRIIKNSTCPAVWAINKRQTFDTRWHQSGRWTQEHLLFPRSHLGQETSSWWTQEPFPLLVPIRDPRCDWNTCLCSTICFSFCFEIHSTKMFGCLSGFSRDLAWTLTSLGETGHWITVDGWADSIWSTVIFRPIINVMVDKSPRLEPDRRSAVVTATLQSHDPRNGQSMSLIQSFTHPHFSFHHRF